MIIQKATLSPFGAAANRSYSFSKGLNVLLGPNEAGKSTLVNAIFAALFIPVDVRKNAEEWTKILQRYLPYPDGDTARVALELILSDDQVMLYSCAWGGSREQRLVLDGGNEVNDPAAIRAHLEQALRFSRGTYESVLFARQEEMNQTLARLRGNENANATISGLLRAALFESGGVSLEKLETLMISEYDRLLNNWDVSSDEPRGGRGIGNPHQTKRGAVLLAYYEAEELRRLLRNTRADEEKVTVLGEEIGRFEAELTLLRGRLADYEKLEEDARKRGSLKPGLDSLTTKENQLMTVISEWPKVEERVSTLSAAIETKKKNLQKLELEHQEAVAVLAAFEKRNLFTRVQQLKTELDSKQTELSGLPAIFAADLYALEEQNRRLTELKAVAGA
ncbi:MAG: AAA family ATPase, partial [Dethiobacteria bacterium]|nr:AAA family ATPase [Dethiobacteria bacterium]